MSLSYRLADAKSAFMVFIATAALLATMVACGDKKGNDGNPRPGDGDQTGIVADVPTPPTADQCLQSPRGGGGNGVWNSYRQYEIRPYPWARRNQSRKALDRQSHLPAAAPMAGDPRGFNLQSIPSSGLCGCQNYPGTIPACGPHGLTCVPVQQNNGHMVATWAYSYNQQQFGFNGYYNAYSGYGYGYNGSAGTYRPLFPTQSSCPNTVAMICRPGSPAAGSAYCQPISNSNQYGIWVYQDSY